MSACRPRQRGSADGFTLLEVMLSLTLLFAITGPMLLAIHQVGELQMRARRQLDAHADIRRLLRQVEEEVREAYLMENEKINLEYIKIEPKGFLELSGATPAEVGEYFSDHRESFRIPEKVNLQYVVFRPKDYRDKVDISQEKIKAYYEENIEDFFIQE